MVVLSGGARLGDVGHAPAFGPADLLRVAAYRSYLDFYNGAQWEGAPSPNERRLTFNYARVFVNKAAAYLMGSGVSFAVEAPEGSGEEGRLAAQHAEMLLSATYEHNALALVDLDTAVDSAVLGDGAFKVTWDAEAGEARVTAVDPAGLTCERQADDYRRLLKVRHSYAAESVGAGTAVLGAAVPQVVEDWTDERVEIWRDGALQGSMTNPYGFIPYVIFPN